MDSGPEIFEAEIVDAGPPLGRGPDGRLLPGQQAVARPKGSKGRLRSDMLAGFQDYLSEHPEDNPLLTLMNISVGRAVDTKGAAIEVPVSVRVNAASRLAQVLIPPSARMAEVVNIDLRAVNLMQEASKIPGARGMMERLANSQGQARLLASGRTTDSHILKVHPGSQAAIESGPVKL